MRESERRVGAIHGRPLHSFFSRVSRRYDLVNHVITWGLDRRWRLEAARECLSLHPGKVLDLCCGTGDLAIHLAQLADGVKLAGVDYSLPMLELATQKAQRLSWKIPFIQGDAANMPFSDGSFDCVGISFALRNLTYKNRLGSRCLTEVLRILRAGGSFVIVESSQPRSKLVRTLLRLYLHCFAYRTGCLLSGNRSAYRHLAESVARFHTVEELRQLLISAGFAEVRSCPLFLGVAAIHVALK